MRTRINLLCLCLLLHSLLTAQTITRCEYFIDNDPGMGNATPLSLSTGDSVTINATITLDPLLQSGIHILYVRVADNNGVWSFVKSFLINAGFRSGMIVAAEYFIDTDPGRGNATPLSLSAGDSVTINAAIAIDPLLKGGVHILYVRVLDNNGIWSFVRSFLINSSFQSKNINAAEYFIDTDPGPGNRTVINFLETDSANVVENVAIPVNLPLGQHKIFIRSRNSKGVWGFNEVFTFDVAGTLPVTWLEFKAYRHNTVAQLEWKTASEFNNRGFDIQRSADGSNFIPIGWINSAGNSSSVQSYSFTDNAPLKGFNFYRLKQIDIDNHSKFSEVRRVVFGSETDFVLAPNPAHDKLQAIFSDVNTGQLSLLDISGRVLWETSYINHTIISIPVEQLPPGVYFIRLRSKEEKIITKKFIKD